MSACNLAGPLLRLWLPRLVNVIGRAVGRNRRQAPLNIPIRLEPRAFRTVQIEDAGQPAKRSYGVVRERAGRPRTKSWIVLGAVSVLLCILLSAPSAQASFGISSFDAATTEPDQTPDTTAGTHPDQLHIHLAFAQSGGLAEGDLRDLHLTLPPSLLVNSAALPQCSQAAFHTPRVSPFQPSLSGESCPDQTQVGVVALHSGAQTHFFGLFNLTAPYGSSEAIGFAPFGMPIELTAEVREPDAAFVFGFRNLPQAFEISGLDLTLWGTPWGTPSPRLEIAPGEFEAVFERDNERGNCLNEADAGQPFGQPGRIITTIESEGKSSSTYYPGTCSIPAALLAEEHSYLSLPSGCSGPLLWEAAARAWGEDETRRATVESHDSEGHPLTLKGCIEPLTRAKLQLRTESAASATGLVFNLDVNDGGGLLNPGGVVRSQIADAAISLPAGLTINPSLGAGLGVCTEADFAREAPATPPGAGCPNASKIGTTEVEGLIGLSEPIAGSVYLAQPYQNPSHALIDLYITVDSPRRGIFEKAEGTLDPDPQGRLTASFRGLPKLHYTHFALSLREGQRSALISPPACGDYRTDILMTPWSDPNLHVPDFSILPISRGEGGGPCPGGAARPFHPGLQAGSLNPQAGAYTPYYLHMTRTDSEQEITSYSATLPPGLLGRIAGVPYCPEAAIAAARARSGTDELEAPSCPAASQIGRTLAGYGVGGVLAYAPGALYLAGPYHGAPLSTVAVDSALVGPFDLGTVIVRSAIRVDPASARVSIDSAGSDPIPHILKGIPLHLRDIRVYIDRPGFTLNPTSCDPLSSLSTLTGAGADLDTPADDVAAGSADRYHLFNCSALGFAPRLSLRLRGSTRRGGFPALRALYRPRPGEANLAAISVALPRTEFLAQSHLGQICAPRQFAAAACPASSIYGHARAFTPLLSAPLEGPVYLRASPNRSLPDLVIALRQGALAIDLSAAIESTSGGAMKASFTALPDAPVSKFVLSLRRGRGSLLENSADICARPSFAGARLAAHDNATGSLRVRLIPTCAHPKKKNHRPRR